MIYVTHDQVEAMTLADRIVVLAHGGIEQVGSPLDLYERPKNEFVAQFIGSPSMNLFPGVIETTGASTTLKLEGGISTTVPIITEAAEVGQKAKLGVRPEDFELATGEDYIFEGKIHFIEALGEVTLLHFNTSRDENPIIAKLPGIHDFCSGQSIRLNADMQKLHLFNALGYSYR